MSTDTQPADPLLQAALNNKDRFGRRAEVLRNIPVVDPYPDGTVILCNGWLLQRRSGTWHTYNNALTWDRVRDRMADHPDTVRIGYLSHVTLNQPLMPGGEA